MCIYHIFFICYFVDRHLGCVHVLAFVNISVVCIAYVYIFESVFLFSSDKYPGVEFLDLTVVLFLIF